MRWACLSISLAASILHGCATTGSGNGTADSALSRAQAAYENGDYSRALPLLQGPARAREPTAQYALGYMYYEGLGTDRDLQTALSWFQRAARNGSEDAVEALTTIAAAGVRLEPPQRPPTKPGSTKAPASVPAAPEAEAQP